jgi:hypothetical protein
VLELPLLNRGPRLIVALPGSIVLWKMFIVRIFTFTCDLTLHNDNLMVYIYSYDPGN